MNHSLQILIVDDDPRMTRTLADILTLSGHYTVEAWSGADALQKAQTKSFDCVLADIRMPEMNGVELHQRLRAAQPGLPVVLMTAFASDELIQRGMGNGVVGVLEKPLNINLLLEFLTALAKNRMVVIVDDDEIFCHTLKDVLEMRGFWVMEITDPHTEVRHMAADAQVLLLDMKLNSISGADVVKKIRQTYAHLPVILITGYHEEMAGAIQAAQAVDVFTCLYKPLEIPRLLQSLSELQLKRLRELIKVQAL